MGAQKYSHRPPDSLPLAAPFIASSLMLPRVFRRFVKKKTAAATAKRQTTPLITAPDNAPAEMEVLGFESGVVLETVEDTG